MSQSISQSAKPRVADLRSGELRSAAIVLNLLLWLGALRAVQALI